MARGKGKLYLEPARQPRLKQVFFARCVISTFAIMILGFAWWWSALFRPALPVGLLVALVFLTVFLIGVGIIQIASRKNPAERFFSSESSSLTTGLVMLATGLTLLSVLVFGKVGQ